jgi:hypothetical protein
MPWFQETTEWKDGVQRNHCYLLNDSRSKMFAFVAQGEREPKVFKSPIKIDIRGRKFVAIKDTWNIRLESEPVQGDVYSVAGSRGDTYTVKHIAGNWTCTCTGFRFHGRCRHIAQIQNSLAK